MNWNTQRGGPWGGGGGHGPWGGGGGPSRPQPPDIEEILRRSQDRVKRFLPSGGSGAKRIVILAVAALIVWFATGFYRVDPDELGVELLFGKFYERTQPGLNWNLPAPIGQVFTPKVTRINAVQIGMRATTEQRRGVAGRAVPEESLMLTGDENIIDIRFVTFWAINDAQKFVFNIRNPEATVKAASEAAMREVVGRIEFEFARTRGRTQIQKEVHALLQQILDSYGSGIQVTDINLQQVEPPGNVLDAFRDVQAASADKERATNEANAYLSEIVQQAQGEAARIRNEAEAYKAEKVALATGEAARFLSVLEEYKQEKDVTRRRIYLETMRGVMSNMEKVLIDSSNGGSGVVPYLPLPELRNNRRPTPPPPPQPPAGAKR